jgi:ribosome-binding factor A
MTAGAPGRRAERVADRIRAELAELLVRGAVRDPAAADAYVTAVRVSDDLKHARVWVQLLRADVDEASRERVVAALNRAAGFLRRELSPRLALKHLPELRFDWDAGGERAARIEELLREDEHGKDPP